MISGDHTERCSQAAAALLRDGYVVVGDALSDLLVSELLVAAEAGLLRRPDVHPRQPARPPFRRPAPPPV